ncbi:MAG: hypothetical protein J7L07_12635 [Candidatus Odinarchaeota archaeon]|nr:hypothetical protein [Candidatus Odinarchaeota archaeon]
MGKTLYDLLVKMGAIKPCEEKTLSGIIDYTISACKQCLLPVSSINIDAKGSNLTIEMIEEESSNYIDEKIRNDDSWAHLPFPMISLLYFLLNKNIGIPSFPVKFNAEYKDGKWIYSFSFLESIEDKIS